MTCDTGLPPPAGSGLAPRWRDRWSGIVTPPPVAPVRPKPDPRPLVLIVDDDPDVRDMLELALGTLGVHTITAADGAEALTLARRRAPDAIVTDLFMPRLDGRQLIWCLRHTPWGRETPVVVFSGGVETLDDILDGPGVVVTDKAEGPGLVLDHLSRMLDARRTARPVRP